jgi:hypothetical protein
MTVEALYEPVDVEFEFEKPTKIQVDSTGVRVHNGLCWELLYYDPLGRVELKEGKKIGDHPFGGAVYLAKKVKIENSLVILEGE